MAAGPPREGGYLLVRFAGRKQEGSMNHSTTRFILTIFAFICFSLCILSFSAWAGQVTLEWDPVSPVPEGYKLFQRTEGQPYDYDNPLYSGSSTTYTATGLEAGQVYYFVVRAFDSGCESDDSNEVSFAPTSGEEGLNDTNPGGNSGGLGGDSSGSDGQSGSEPGTGDSSGNDGGDGSGTVIDNYGTNSDPAAPEIVTPNQIGNLCLTPRLVAGRFHDSDGDGHAKTQWQISTTADFSNLIMNRVCYNQLTEFSLTDMILDTETTYYWRVRYTDSAGGTSAWSDVAVFSTTDDLTIGDADGDGLPDEQEVEAECDLDGNGQKDELQSDMLVVKTAAGDGLVAVKCNSPDVQVVGLKSLLPEQVAGEDTPPGTMTFGLISFKLFLAEGVTTATVTVYFSEQLEPDAKWYKYSIEDGWQAYEYAMFGHDGHTVTLVLEDGGIGDEDGVRNGIIVDPSGMSLGDGQSSDPAKFSIPGCFIESGTTSCDFSQAMSLKVVSLLMLMGCCLFVGCRIRKNR